MIGKKLIYIFILSFFVKLQAQDSLSVSLTKFDKKCTLGSANLTINFGHSPYEVLWSNNTIGESTGNLEFGNYSVKVTNASLRDTTIYFSVEELECLPTPENHFTPNGDLYNDNWEIGNISNYPNFDLYVYNRWEQVVHLQQNTFILWDGKSIEISLPDASYYYIIYLSPSDKSKIVSGSVSILR